MARKGRAMQNTMARGRAKRRGRRGEKSRRNHDTLPERDMQTGSAALEGRLGRHDGDDDTRIYMQTCDFNQAMLA